MTGARLDVPACVVALGLALAADAARSAALPAPVEGWLRGDAATGDWLGLRSDLSDRGLRPYGVFTGEVWRNFAGGLERATDWQGLLEFGVDVDLEEALGWRGARLHASALWIQDDGDSSAELVGNFDDVSNIGGEADLRFYQLHLEQEIHDGALRLKIGQLVLDDDFMISEGASLFLDSSFGALPVQSANSPAPIYPVAALGGLVRWLPREDVRLQLGVYAGDAGTQDSNGSGFDYDLGSSEGVAVFAEAGIDTDRLGRDGALSIGGYYDSGDFTDFDSGSTESGNFALYVVWYQVLIGTRDESRLSVFVRGGIAPLEDRSVVDGYLDAGVTARGWRERDRVGLGFSHARFGDDFVSARGRAGSPVTDAESVIELTYRAQLAPWLTLQPDLQYRIDPLDARARNAFIGVLRATVVF